MDPENLGRGGRVPHPRPEWKLYFSEHAAYSIVSIFVMQGKVTLTFRKIELKGILWNDFQSKIVALMVKHLENTRKKGGRGPLGPSPKSAYGVC